MGRTVVADEIVQETVLALSKLKDWTVGLVIGQNTVAKDYVCHLVLTPEEESEDDTDTSEPLVDKKNKHNKKVPCKMEDIDDACVVQHAKEVSRILPGGLDVIGIFVAFPTDTLPPSILSKLKQMLLAIYKALGKQMRHSATNDFNEKIALHIYPANQKVTCKTFDTTNIQSAAKPAEFKYQQGGVGWHRLDCKLALDLSIPVNSEQINWPLLKQIQFGLQPFCVAVNEAVVIIDGNLRKDKEPLDARLTGGKEIRKSGKKKDKAASMMHNVDIFLNIGSNNNLEKCVKQSCLSLMNLRGTLQCRAFVHSRATYGEAVQAVKQDTIRSLMARYEIHCEDLLPIDEEQSDPSVVHEPPRRVFAPLPGGELSISDYVFPGENASDSLETYHELFGLTLTEEDVEFDCERFAETSDMTALCQETRSLMASASDLLLLPSGCSERSNVVVLGLSTALAILAASVSYIWYRE